MNDQTVIIELDNGKYTYIFDDKGQRVLRFGEEWRSLAGDKFVLSLAFELADALEALNKILQTSDDPVSVAHEHKSISEAKLISNG